jgi:hypothetical protein
MKKVIVVILFTLAVYGLAYAADEYISSGNKFEACEDKAGAGLFWVDTTCGRTWWVDPGKMRWVFFGLPDGAKRAPVGTYIPFENKSGEGVFVLNTATGEGWWTKGRKWKRLGVPGK